MKLRKKYDIFERDTIRVLKGGGALKPEEIPECREGDELPDTRIDDFVVYAGSQEDRRRLQQGDPELLDELARDLHELLKKHEDATGSD